MRNFTVLRMLLGAAQRLFKCALRKPADVRSLLGLLPQFLDKKRWTLRIIFTKPSGERRRLGNFRGRIDGFRLLKRFKPRRPDHDRTPFDIFSFHVANVARFKINFQIMALPNSRVDGQAAT